MRHPSQTALLINERHLKQDDCNGGEGAGVVCDTRDLKDILDSECFQVAFKLNLNHSFLSLDWCGLPAWGSRYWHGESKFCSMFNNVNGVAPILAPILARMIIPRILRSGTQVGDYRECQQRCRQTEGCEHFSFFQDPDNTTIKGWDQSSCLLKLKCLQLC